MRKILFSIYRRMFKVLSGHGIGRIYPVRFVHKFIISHLGPTFAEVGGHKMFLLDSY